MNLQEQINTATTIANPETQFIIGPQVPPTESWFDQTQLAKAREHGAACPTAPPTEEGALNSFVLLQYYDLPLTEYIAYYRFGDPALLSYARKCADAWWKMPGWIDEGRTRGFIDGAGPSPRHAGLGGLILRAMDGRPELWDWLAQYTIEKFYVWVGMRLNNPELWYGLREGAFMLQYASWLVKVLPDSYPLQAGGQGNGIEVRARLLVDIESAVVQYFGRLQYPDGSWRNSSTPDEARDEDGGIYTDLMQPFMVGLLMSAYCDAHQLPLSSAVKTSIETQMIKACRHLYLDGPYAKDIYMTNFGVYNRGFHYFYHGGTTVNPTKYANGYINPNTDVRWHIESDRQAISTIVPAYGYLHRITGEQFFKTAGDELWDSAYGGGDGFRAMMADTAKNYNQHARRAGSYPAWVGGEIVPPVPVPPPVVVPPPSPTTSPDGTKAVEIVDAEGNRWTIGPEHETLRNGVKIGGAGVIYKWLGGVVYVLTTDNRTWYRWTGTGWAENLPTPQVEPGGTVPPPVIQPPPTPVDEYVTKEILPKVTEANRTRLYQEMYALNYAAWEELRGNKIKFRKFGA